MCLRLCVLWCLAVCGEKLSGRVHKDLCVCVCMREIQREGYMLHKEKPEQEYETHQNMLIFHAMSNCCTSCLHKIQVTWNVSDGLGHNIDLWWKWDVRSFLKHLFYVLMLVHGSFNWATNYFRSCLHMRSKFTSTLLPLLNALVCLPNFTPQLC